MTELGKTAVAELGEQLTVWTVRLTVGCYLLRFVVDAGFAGNDRRIRIARWFWTAGCLLFLVHVVCAFAFFHEWSHQRAYAHTAAQTQDIVGWNWGGGLYFNYLFTVVWIADVAAWWYRKDRPEATARTVHTAVHVFLAFMVFNATIVFGPWFWKWIGAAVGILLMCLRWHRRRRG